MGKILIADDEEAIRKLLCRLLLAANHDVTQAEDGLEALEKAKRMLPDLVISDVIMPNLDGIGLCAALKNNPATAHIRFIFLTTQAKIGQIEEAMKNSPDGYITKPFELQRVLQKVDSVLGKGTTSSSNHGK